MPAIATCGISQAREFHSLWRLPALPLTERFGPYSPAARLAYDQELVISVPTGHVQLRHQLDPEILYASEQYSFRTGRSQSSRQGVTFFLEYLADLTRARSFASVVDVGGNDLFVARHLVAPGRHCAVIDPICADLDGQVLDGIRVFGRFVEQVDLAHDLPAPDLLICRHTLEHLARPRDVIAQWFQQCAADCLYVIEVPCFEHLVEAQRFDAVFHQHLHYYDLASFRHLLWECGGEYLSHAFNRQGSCGGALLLAFRRAQRPQPQPALDLDRRIRHLEARIANYRTQMNLMAELLEALPRPVYGYGASLMLATLAYHLHTDFSRLECILDDDPARDGATYQNLPVTVRHTAKVAPPPDSSYLVTSLESLRPIYRRIAELKPRRILVPLIA
ncbi:MAG: class I SAM-dependent methyltransferase [Verrucomicrobia bacterium]|nr:class I SAM-dependent methyltransferase [Verrucomicrobiota bacterium]